MRTNLYDVSVSIKNNWAAIEAIFINKQKKFHTVELSINLEERPKPFVSRALSELGFKEDNYNETTLKALDVPLSISPLDVNSEYNLKMDRNNEFSIIRKA